MGANESKPCNDACKSKSVLNINEKQKSKRGQNTLKKKNVKSFEGWREEYEDQYMKLEQEHQKLRDEFLELKAKYDTEITNVGDFTSHSTEIRRRLDNALFERNVAGNNMFETSSTNELKISEDSSQFERDERDTIANTEEPAYKTQLDELQRELDKTLKVNIELQKELESEKVKFEEKANHMKEEFTTKALLLCERYEDEKKEINSIWEKKLTEVINNCNQDITTFRAKLNKEKSTLEEKLENAMSELSALDNKNKLLSHLLEDIRSRYESRESRTEDLERIADLEGQLIIQAEELEKQKDLIENMKTVSPSASLTISTGKKCKKNKKRKKRSQVEIKQEGQVASL